MFKRLKRPHILLITIALALTVCLSLSIVGLLVAASVFPNRPPAEAYMLLTNADPTPDYISGLDPAPGFNGDLKSPICVYVWDGPPLTTNIDSDKYLYATLNIMIDDRQVFADPISQQDMLSLIWIIDKQGNKIARGGPLQSCYNIPMLTGLHLATLRIKSMSGKIYSYSWAFNFR